MNNVIETKSRFPEVVKRLLHYELLDFCQIIGRDNQLPP